MQKDNLTAEHQRVVLNLQLKLGGLGIDATFAGVEDGPVVTSYYYALSASMPMSRVMQKSEDLALALDADKVTINRIGKHIVVFVPNEERKYVDFKENLFWYLKDEATANMSLPIPVGMDATGSKSSFDLADMPHCLIAGSTGSGKSVFEANIICSLCYFHNSNDLHFYLADTKGLDLPLFKTLPHVKQVATNVEEFLGMSQFLMAECRKRMTILQGAACQNIRDFHRLVGTSRTMPWIVVLLDEFADLADLDKQERLSEKELSKIQDRDSKYNGIPTVRQWLNSITRISRAAGIHIIACTQRSSVKVIDGDIKANFPARIALRLPTGIDSRTILGSQGAENLLGKGDMLIQRPDADTIGRFHGPFVSMNDITELVVSYEYMKDVFSKR